MWLWGWEAWKWKNRWCRQEARGGEEEDKCVQTDMGWQVTTDRRQVRKVVQRKPADIIGGQYDEGCKETGTIQE